MFFSVDEVDAFGQAVGSGGLAAHLDAVQAIDVEGLAAFPGFHVGDAGSGSLKADAQGIHFRSAYGEIGSCAAQCTALSAAHDVLFACFLGYAVKAFHVLACFIVADEGHVAVGYGSGLACADTVYTEPRCIAFGCGILEIY